MFNCVKHWVLADRRFWWVIAALCIALLAFGLYLQEVVGLNPCPMCIVQRYTFVLIAVCAIVMGFVKSKAGQMFAHVVGIILSGFGAFVAARQVLLQWNPTPSYSCGRDLFGMIESFPLREVIPMIFKGTGDCSAVDWIFLGMSIAQWSFLVFAFLCVLLCARVIKSRAR
jgi:disulfide bond formation protein DsbB